VAVGIIALAWPSVTVLALVILFAVYAFMAAGLQAARAFSSRTAGPVIGHLLLGLVDLAAGVIALAWPGPTALVLVLIVGVWAIQREICGGSVQKRTLAWLRPWTSTAVKWCEAAKVPGREPGKEDLLRRTRALSDSGSRMGAAARCQVRSRTVTMPGPMPLTCRNVV
jgi:hypothetical protein